MILVSIDGIGNCLPLISSPVSAEFYFFLNKTIDTGHERMPAEWNDLRGLSYEMKHGILWKRNSWLNQIVH